MYVYIYILVFVFIYFTYVRKEEGGRKEGGGRERENTNWARQKPHLKHHSHLP